MVHKRLLHLRVPVTLDEEQGIRTNARETGLSVAKDMHQVGLPAREISGHPGKQLQRVSAAGHAQGLQEVPVFRCCGVLPRLDGFDPAEGPAFVEHHGIRVEAAAPL